MRRFEILRGGKRVVLGNSTFDIVTQNELRAQFGEHVPDAEGRHAYMAGLTLRTTSIKKALGIFQDAQIPIVVTNDRRVIVPAPHALNTVLEFVE